MKLHRLITEKDYDRACDRLYDLAFPIRKLSSSQLLERDILMAQIDYYQNIHENFDNPDPIEAIKFAMEQRGLKQRDLANFFGGETRASEVLNYKRPLSTTSIKLLNEYFGIPLPSLVNVRLNNRFEKFNSSDFSNITRLDKNEGKRNYIAR